MPKRPASGYPVAGEGIPIAIRDATNSDEGDSRLHHRQHLVRWIIKTARTLQLCRNSVHSALYILDTFMDTHNISEDRLDFVAMTSLSLAAKFEESDTDVPRLSYFRGHLDDIVQSDYIQMEFIMMSSVGWKLIPTASHFADYYSFYATEYNDLHCCSFTNYDELQSLAKKLILKFVDAVPLDDSFIQSPPSFVGASCIVATRIFLKLHPPWPNTLENSTGYRYCHMLAYVKKLLSFAEE